MFKFLRRSGEDKTELAVEKSRRTWFGQMATLFNRQRLDQELWDDLEELLISADAGVTTTQQLLNSLRDRVSKEGIREPEAALDLLKQEMVDILSLPASDPQPSPAASPLVVLIVGVNGVGKTTSIAKLARWYAEEGKRVILGGGDTFRAAAAEQLQTWGALLDMDVVAHRTGADPAAVAFDTIKAAKARGADVAIIDTAGRLHTKLNLMEELKKIHRVLSREGTNTAPVVLLTLDATTGQNGLLQARSFTDTVRCDGVFLAKLDGTAKGGIVLAIANELRIPVVYIGTGESLDDIAAFDPRNFVEGLFGSGADEVTPPP